MLESSSQLLQRAARRGYAVGAFNVYNLEGALAVIAAAEASRSPAMLQIHPGALHHGGAPLLALCLKAAERASVPMAVHLDHCSEAQTIVEALDAGLVSVMADGSHLTYEDNVAFTQAMVARVHAEGGTVEAELGRIAGTEDDLTVDEVEARLTDLVQAVDFVHRTGVDMLAVCIGNVHGRYRRPPDFDLVRLQALRDVISIPLVLHGTSGVPDKLVQRCIKLGISKFNVNTEVRSAYLEGLRARFQQETEVELVPLMQAGMAAMQDVVTAKLLLFGSTNQV